ncbi:MAG TPA: alpha/beta hydrolase, partial [Pseudobdellovibrionaceae bacterium]|nr:alpha/beta hydrolase [Pseudobdellovibrionaceae bacterium]
LVGRELSKNFGVLEPLQTKDSIDGQIKELRAVIQSNADVPVKLVGWSWGAWLGYLLAAKYPDLVQKLILVDSGPFEEKYVKEMNEVRMSRLSDSDKTELQNLESALQNANLENKNALFKKFGAIFGKVDSYNPDNDHHESV